jgi:Mn2+/Fe2+ NRAMP family transporter
MSDLVNRRSTNYMAYAITAVIIGLNLLLLYKQLGGSF